METILFFIKRKKLLKDGTASVFVRVTFGKLSSEVATGKSVLPSQWVATKGRAKGNTLKNKQINAFLDQMEYTLHDLTLQIQRDLMEMCRNAQRLNSVAFTCVRLTQS